MGDGTLLGPTGPLGVFQLLSESFVCGQFQWKPANIWGNDSGKNANDLPEGDSKCSPESLSCR